MQILLSLVHVFQLDPNYSPHNALSVLSFSIKCGSNGLQFIRILLLKTTPPRQNQMFSGV